MGAAKNYTMKMTRDGMSLYGAQDKYVCDTCFEDHALALFVQQNATSNTCSFCKRRSRRLIAADLTDIVSRMNQCIGIYYDQPENCMGYCSGEGGWLGTTYDTDELLDELELDLPHDTDGELRRVIAESLGEQLWCHRDPYGSTEEESLADSWRSFCNHIKHERRFFFLDSSTKRGKHALDEPLLDPAEMLSSLAKFCLDFGLIRSLPAGTKLIRVRQQREGSQWRSVRDLGPPPREKATQSNRMSPPGVPMFYACSDAEAAICETATGAGFFAIGEFVLQNSIYVLDLTKMKSVPSLFDLDKSRMRPKLKFLNQFAREISKPIERDNRIHIEYVPPQVVTEYFRHYVRYKEQPILGISYRSSRRIGGICYALFATQDDLVLTPAELAALGSIKRLLYNDDQRWIALNSCSEREVSNSDLKGLLKSR